MTMHAPLRIFLSLLTLLFAIPALAGSFTVAPTRVELAPERHTAGLTVENRGGEPVLLQVETYAWKAREGREVLEPDRDLLAVPPLLRLAPGERRVVRLGLRTPFPERGERAWRLFLTEIPEAADGGARRGGVRFALRIGLPVFARAPGAAADVLWRVEPAEGGLSIEARNAGDAHIRILGLALDLGGRRVPVSGEPDYLLPGEVAVWRVRTPVPATGTPALVVTTPGGERRVALAAASR